MILKSFTIIAFAQKQVCWKSAAYLHILLYVPIIARKEIAVQQLLRSTYR